MKSSVKLIKEKISLIRKEIANKPGEEKILFLKKELKKLQDDIYELEYVKTDIKSITFFNKTYNNSDIREKINQAKQRSENHKAFIKLYTAQKQKADAYEAFMNDKTPAPEMDVPSSIYSYDIRLTPKVINAGIGGKSYRKRSQFKVFKQS